MSIIGFSSTFRNPASSNSSPTANACDLQLKYVPRAKGSKKNRWHPSPIPICTTECWTLQQRRTGQLSVMCIDPAPTKIKTIWIQLWFKHLAIFTPFNSGLLTDSKNILHIKKKDADLKLYIYCLLKIPLWRYPLPNKCQNFKGWIIMLKYLSCKSVMFLVKHAWQSEMASFSSKTWSRQ